MVARELLGGNRAIQTNSTQGLESLAKPPAGLCLGGAWKVGKVSQGCCLQHDESLKHQSHGALSNSCALSEHFLFETPLG